jgi:hypothetical protein
MKILNYSDYETYICFDIDKVPLYESKGIPNVIKVFSNIIYNKINIEENEYFIEINQPDFNIKLDFNIKKGKNFYGSCFFKDVENLKCIINIEYSYWDEYELKRLITHELLHLYELYNRVNKNSKNRLQWNLIKIINSIKTEDKLINDLKTLIYWTSDQEINASIAELYPILYSKNSTNKDELKKELHSNRIYKIIEQTESFDWRNYKLDFDKLYYFFEKISKIKTNQKFNLFKNPKTHKDIMENLNNWQKLFQKKVKYIRKKSIKIIEEVTEDLK